MNLGEYAASQANVFEFFSGVELDASQTRQLYFQSAQIRDAFFDALPNYYRSDKVKYIRRNGTLKVEIPNNVSVNYMRFRNVGAGQGKWFYAFVLQCDYLNPTTCIITWKLDVYQTFIHDCYFRECNIARDTIPPKMDFRNYVIPEGIDYGDYEIFQTRNLADLTPTVYLVYSTVDLALSGRDSKGNPLLQSAGGSIIQGTPTSLDVILCRTKEKFRQLMNTLIDYPWVAQCVQGVYGVPSFMIEGVVTTSVRIGSETFERIRNSTTTPPARIVDIGNMLPYPNNSGIMPDFNHRKLWQYPYTFFEVATADGSSLILKPELFNELTISLKATIYSVISPQPSALVLIPNYGGSSDLFSFSLTVSDFTMYPVPNDQYMSTQEQLDKAYALNRKQAAQNLKIGAQYIDTNLMYQEAHNVVSLGGSALGMLDPTAWTYGGVTGHATSMAQTAISSQEAYVQAQQQKEIANRMEQQAAEREMLTKDQNQTAVTLAGRLNVGSCPVLNAIGTGNYISFRVWTIKEKTANRLSKYFDMFGLKVDNVEVPNFTSMRGIRYQYIKMASVNLYGAIPNEYLLELQNIFLDGITLWKDPSTVGYYGGNF